MAGQYGRGFSGYSWYPRLPLATRFVAFKYDHQQQFLYQGCRELGHISRVKQTRTKNWMICLLFCAAAPCILAYPFSCFTYLFALVLRVYRLLFLIWVKNCRIFPRSVLWELNSVAPSLADTWQQFFVPLYGEHRLWASLGGGWVLHLRTQEHHQVMTDRCPHFSHTNNSATNIFSEGYQRYLASVSQ